MWKNSPLKMKPRTAESLYSIRIPVSLAKRMVTFTASNMAVPEYAPWRERLSALLRGCGEKER